MNETEKIGVVTVTYNSEPVLADFIESCRKQDFTNFVLYVVDNASKDCSLEMLRSLGDGIPFEIIENDQNLGVAEANNQGIHRAIEDGCSSILLINNDVVFGSSLFSDLLSGKARHGASIIFPKMYYFDNPKKIWCAGGTFIKSRGWTALHYGIGEIDEGQFDHEVVTEYSPTCCALIDTAVFNEIGFMDPDYFVYCDDTDFFFRAMQAGQKAIYLGSACLYHKVSSLTGGGGGESPFSLRYMTRNRVLFLKKFVPGKFWRAVWLLHLQAQMARDLVVGRTSFKGYRIMQRAFVEGMQLATTHR